MILKIRAANELTDDSWRFFDGVNGLHYSVYPPDIYAAKKAEFQQFPESDDYQRVWFWDEALPPGKVALMTFDSDSTGPIEITSNTTVYLLNDHGKTVGRLI